MPLISSKRFVIGGIGGLAPVFALLIAVDLDKNLLGTTASQVAGYTLRVLALFAIGGFIAWLHETEDKPFKLFEIGLGAPALLAGLITSKSIIPQQSVTRETQGGPPIAWLMPISAAHAQQASSQQSPPSEVRTFSIPKAEGSDAFWQGLVGAKPTNIYYVVVGSHLKYEDAKKQADQVTSKFPKFKAEVYAPYGVNPYYAVVIGANLTQPRASELQSEAVQSGLPKDTYLWTFPSFRN